MKRKTSKKVVAFVSMLTLVVSFCAPTPVVKASGLTYLKDALSTLEKDAFADHEIMFVTADGVVDTETIVITFPSDFDGETGDPLDSNDIDLFIDASANHICGDGAAQTIVTGASPGVNEWGAVFSGTENRILTLKSGGGTAVVAATNEVCVEIGENATGGAANAQYDNPTTSGEKTITFAVGGTDTGSCVVHIVDDDSVAVTGSVSETLTFVINDFEISFGTLTSSNARFAGASDGTDGPTSASAHTMTIATNAPTGYAITYNGSTLTDTTPEPDTTVSVATISGDEDGTPDSEQFAIGFTVSDDATIESAYDQAGATFNYSFVADTTTKIISETTPTATEIVNAFYLANIAGTTESGTYSTSITYIVSGNF